jgi:hypothetical protein
MVVAAITIFNPVGLAFIGSAIRYSSTDWLRDFSVFIVLSGVFILLLIGIIEWLVRRRVAARRATMPEPQNG